jgi:hypothetical protein
VAAKSKRRGILQLLDHGSELKVPFFQRSFAWENDQVREYWDDLKLALDRDGGSSEHFLGLLVVDTSSHIQDGQQRLATTLLLAGAIYEAADAAKKAGVHDVSLATDVIGQVSPALRTGAAAPLRLGKDDQPALLKRAGIRDAPESVRRLNAARSQLAAYVTAEMSKLATPDEKLRRLKKWSEFLRRDAYVIVLTVKVRDAHNIFETLNTRGVRLSNGDLVKSHLIARATDTGAAVKTWDDVTTALKDDKGRYEKDLESFLLHYYGSRYGRTVKGELFADLRPHIANRDAQTVLDELLASAALYRALVDPAGKKAFWADLGDGTQEAIELVNGLGLRQLRYLLLAVLRDYASKQVEKRQKQRRADAVIKIARWSVRGLVHRELGTSEAEKVYISAAEKMRADAGPLDTAAQLKKWFVDGGILNVDDLLFETAFRDYDWDSKSNHTRARAILYALEYYETPKKSGLKPRDTLTVEHVLPQSPEDGAWTNYTDDERAVYTYRLGNLLLIDGPSRANDALGSKSWADKRDLIKGYGPQTPLTTAAVKKTTWTKATIDGRQRELAKLAPKAFAA